ncbi:hypothetical protein [Mucilaginibacter sp.]|uniref:hypothetical protein n=1 Tax=Mucilaginibacter sp. TaxID=1882438 RepID=UPI0028499EA3|nr:hypothetical protein [Mucilaginibacter sp.]MDR3694777.1 hypothetical protein [Mucilaginibacter sp.]
MQWSKKFNYPRWAIINFIVLTLFGILLRYMQLYGLPVLDYQFILHAHSHFAFAGWMFFAIALLISDIITGGKYSSGYKYVFVFTLISAYGMLVSFSFQGYKPVSIVFSTLFVLLTYRFTYLVFRGKILKNVVNETTYKLIRCALIFLCISSLGPFTLGPLAVLGFKNTSYYQDAIYYYLHFQMNGFMFLAALGLLASTSITTLLSKNDSKWLNLFIYSTIPVYFIFTLWNKPHGWVWILAGLGAGVNLLSWLILCFNFRKDARQFSFLAKAALVAATLKIIFQLLICLPAIGEWAFNNRNLIIGYIHLLTLGIIMPLIIDQFIQRGFLNTGKIVLVVNWSYIISVVIYLSLLFIQPLLSLFSIYIPQYQFLLFVLCLLFLPIGLMLLSRTKAGKFSAK